MSKSLLEQGKIAVDIELASQLEETKTRTLSKGLSWASQTVVLHAIATSVLTAVLFLGMPRWPGIFGSPTAEASKASFFAHGVIGIVLGMLLVARVVLGSMRLSEAAANVTAFNKSLRTIAVLSNTVSDALTISAGAELEKKATAKFRYELVRLLNLAFYCYQLMLKGLKLRAPPASLVSNSRDGGKIEAEVRARPAPGPCARQLGSAVGARAPRHPPPTALRAPPQVLGAVSNPTVMVCKYLAALIEQQRQAGRVTNEQATAFVGEIAKVIDTYHASRAQLLAPMSASMGAFTYFFVVVWMYTVCVVIAWNEDTDAATLGGTASMGGVGLPMGLSFGLSLFVFGLYEAGTVVEQPLKEAIDLVPLEASGFELSDDLSNLVDDPDSSVPVFLSPKAVKRV